ncbi:hypothetical protein [Bacillus atrophaeus]|nr:hypothetical protein [Bacillus atrophaeus]
MSGLRLSDGHLSDDILPGQQQKPMNEGSTQKEAIKDANEK